MVSEGGLSSPLCWAESPCNGLQQAVNNSKSGDTILLVNNGNSSNTFNLCLPGILDKYLLFKGIGAAIMPKIGCFSDNKRGYSDNTSHSEESNRFQRNMNLMLEITNGAFFENLWLDYGSVIIYNANVTFTNCTINDAVIYVMGRDTLSLYSLGYSEVKDIWDVIESTYRSNGSLHCHKRSYCVQLCYMDTCSKHRRGSD